MKSILIKCPRTGLQINELVSLEETGRDIYVAVKCPACSGVHLVNPGSNEVLGSTGGDASARR